MKATLSLNLMFNMIKNFGFIFDGEKAEIGEHRFWHNGEHVKISETEWKYVPQEESIINEWLNFSALTEKRTAYIRGEYKEIEIPLILLQDSWRQTLSSESYQELTKNLGQKIKYLKTFDFSHASEKKISDAVRLMGFVNSCAIKGGNRRTLTKTEKMLNDLIYRDLKKPFLDNLADFCIKEENGLLSYDNSTGVLYIDNPVTDVQVSFHYEADNWFYLRKTDESEWNNSTHSFVYSSPQELKYYEKILANLVPSVLDYYHIFTKDSTMDKEELSDDLKKRIDFYKNIGLITDEEIQKILTDDDPDPCYTVVYGNGECVNYDFKNDEEAIEFWRKHLNDRMPILDMWNYYTDEHLAKPEK
jgi:hypothetical protein